MPEITDDIHPAEGADFTHLSDLFKYISHFRRGGHQIGRKVGDMLEVLTYAAIYRDQELRKRLILEPKVFGFSGAGHKVEFGLFHTANGIEPEPTMANMFAFIECKKVGVEQTINSTYKKAYEGRKNLVPYGAVLPINLNPRWAERTQFEVRFEWRNAEAVVTITKNGAALHSSPLLASHRYMVGLTVTGQPFFVDQERSLRDIEESIRACKILKVSAVAENGVTCILEDCLAGPQTPEKAKQASFVALDVRKGMFGQFDKRPNETECQSVLVLTEFSHWEKKSINMITASLDHNLVVDDGMVIDAMVAYEAAFGEDFLPQISKEAFRSNNAVRQLSLEIVEAKGGRIFRDVADNSYKAFGFRDSAFVVS